MMSKRNVNLGLTTRRMSIATCQDRRVSRSILCFLSLSTVILLSNIFATGLVQQLRHSAMDQVVTITDTLNTPFEHIKTVSANLDMLFSAQETQARLFEENKRLMQWYQEANRLEAENQELKTLLKMKDDKAHTSKGAKVISDTKTHYAHTILVKSGRDEGTEKGQGVLSHEGLIGRIIDTGEKTSRVLLLSDVNSRIPVTIKGSKRRAILAGTNDSDPILDHLTEDHTIAEGEEVITSGHGGVFPYGVPVGKTYIKSNGDIAVRPFADPERSDYVQIVDYGIPAGSASRSVASGSTGTLR